MAFENHKDICDAFDVDEQGIITSPGKFEGEPTYTVYYWEAWMNGAWDAFDGDVTVFSVWDEDRVNFPALEGVDEVRLWQRDDGFVCTAV